MSDDNTVTSPTEAPAQTGDDKLSNMSVDKAAQHLMKLSTQKEHSPVETAKPEDSSVIAPAEMPQEETPDTEQADPVNIQDSEEETDNAPEQEQAESDSEDVLSQLDTLDPKAKEIARAALNKQKERLVGKFEKRIGKEVSKRKNIDQQVQSLSEQLTEIKNQSQSQQQATPPPPPPVLNPSNPLGHIADIQSLNQEFTKAKEALRTSEDLIAQMEDNDMSSIEYGGQEFTRQSVKTAMRNAKRVVEDYAPQQAQYLQARTQSSQQAFDMFPWISNKNSTEYVMAQRFMNDPSVAGRADRDVVVGLLVEGFKAVEARKGASVEKKPTIKAKAPASQAEFSSSSGATRAPDSEISRARNNSEIDKLLNKKGGLKVNEAARLLLHTERNLQKR